VKAEAEAEADVHGATLWHAMRRNARRGEAMKGDPAEGGGQRDAVP
jgi:hypothetical protein